MIIKDCPVPDVQSKPHNEANHFPTACQSTIDQLRVTVGCPNRDLIVQRDLLIPPQRNASHPILWSLCPKCDLSAQSVISMPIAGSHCS
jgi:hypothetical protein